MTYIDGIAASENIDSSGERISIAGMDISSLMVDGIFNFEHKNDLPDQIVGKVLFAKKIFSDKDCDDERQAYFWQKCQTPFVYVMGELFDDYKESAKEIAGMFRYDADKRDQNERNVMNFSIEGAKIEKVGIDIVRSIARKVTITVLPCNKAAIAEMVPAEGAKPKDDIDSLFKAETFVEIELIKSEDIDAVMETLKKAVPNLKLVSTPDARGTHIGKTKSGKDVHSHEKVHNYKAFGAQDHKDAANLHYGAIKAGGDPKINQHHMQKMKLHMQASHSAEKRESRVAASVASAHANSGATKVYSQTHRKYATIGDLDKALTAGSAMSAPANKTGGAALAKECVDPKLHKGCTHGNLSKAEERVSTGPKGNPVHLQPGDKVQIKGLKHKATLKEHMTTASGQKKAVFHGHFGNDIHVNHEHLHDNFVTKIAKSDYWLERAEQEYANWNKKEQFREFMSKRMPKMTKSQIDAFGATLVLKKSLEQESTLEEMHKALKFGDGKPHTGPDATPKSKVPEHHKGKAKDVKGKTLTEVEHVEPHYSGSHDAVYLKSGHRSEHQPTGKYKVGDKVTIKAHIQGTHILHHGHDND